MEYTTEQKRELEQVYDDVLPQCRAAENHLLDLVKRAIAQIDDKRLVRAKVRGSRIKDPDSVRRKAEAHGLEPREACLSIGDLVGARIVCNTVEDVRRFKELLRRELPFGETVEEQDYVTSPKGSGYRGIHLNFRVEAGSAYGHLRISCEVQIRTLLQDSWAELVHSDIYKEEGSFPADLRDRTRDLATMLAAADEVASRIRGRVMQESKVEPEAVHLDVVTKESLAYVFAEVFGRRPPDYAVQDAHEACLNAGINSVSGLQAKLSDKNFRDAITKAYHDELRLGFDISPEDIFALMPVAVARSDKEAAKKARRLARGERKEIETIWRSEILSELPDSWEKFGQQLESQQVDVETIAEVFGVASVCSVCGTTIVDDYAFLEAIADHYGKDMDYDLLPMLHDAADCWADDEYSHLCSYHAHQASKDD